MTKEKIADELREIRWWCNDIGLYAKLDRLIEAIDEDCNDDDFDSESDEDADYNAKLSKGDDAYTDSILMRS